MVEQKLAQVIAVEKSVKTRVTSDVTKLYHAAQKPALFNGFVKSFKKLKDEADQQPTQSQRVQAKATAIIRDVSKHLTELFDVTAAKDYANCTAAADVVVDGEKLVTRAPVPYLLFLEKQLVDLHTSIAALPTLDPAEEWKWDDAAEVYKTPPVESLSTKKVQKALVLLQPTDKHPGQAQVITEDENVGVWENIKMSGALQEERRRTLLVKIEKLQRAVKYAREEANTVAAPQQLVGQKLLEWITAA